MRSVPVRFPSASGPLSDVTAAPRDGRMGPMALHITGDPAADELLSTDAFALLTGMLLDQQVAMETAFAGPLKIQQRLGSIDPQAVAGDDPERFVELFKQILAVHRFPGSMAGRVQALAQAVVDDWGGDAARDLAAGRPRRRGGAEATEGLAGIRRTEGEDLPRPARQAAGDRGARVAGGPGSYGEDGSHRSVADIVDPESLAKVRATKQAAKAAAKAAK